MECQKILALILFASCVLSSVDFFNFDQLFQISFQEYDRSFNKQLGLAFMGYQQTTLVDSSREKGKYQESIQSSTTPVLRHHMRKRQNTRKYHTQDSKEVSPFTAGDHKAARNRQDSIIKTNLKHEKAKRIHNRSTALERSINKSLEGLNM